MGRRYAFELFFPAENLADALNGLSGMLPTIRRRRSARPKLQSLGLDLKRLTPDTPLICEMVSILFPADDVVRGFRSDWEDHDSEWTDGGVECLPVGGIDLEVRIGATYAQLTCKARTSGISDVFQNSPAAWARFAGLLQSTGGLVGLFNDWSGTHRYPLLPNGLEVIELNYHDFVLEERETYWHLDVDTFVSVALNAPRIAAG